MNIVIFDLDGCVSDDRWRLDLLPPQPHVGKPPEAFDEYNRRCGMDEPLLPGLELLDGYAQDVDVVVWFITARPVAYRDRTWEWLHRHFAFANTPLLSMRAPDDMRSSPELKAGKVAHLFNEAPASAKIIAAFDDRDDVLAEYAKMACMTDALIQRVDADGVRTISYGTSANSKPRTAANALLEGAELFAERNKVYKDNHKVFGRVMAALYPDGLTLVGEDVFAEFGIFVQIISKITRHASNENGHHDSIRDTKVYAAMLEILLEEK